MRKFLVYQSSFWLLLFAATCWYCYDRGWHDARRHYVGVVDNALSEVRDMAREMREMDGEALNQGQDQESAEQNAKGK